MTFHRFISRCLASLLLAGCSEVPAKPNHSAPSQIASKVSLYVSLQASALDSYGWAHDKCDSLLFTSLCKVGGGCQAANVFDAEGEPGQWFRHKVKDCFPLESGSDISKDMILGLVTYLMETGDKASAQRIVDYGASHDWVMGRGELSRTFLGPPLRWLVLEFATGQANVDQTDWPSFPVNTGYRAHLDVLSILGRAKLRGGATTEAELSYLKAQADRVPRNALFQAAYHRFSDGDQSAAYEILLDPSIFPAERLPSKAERCTEYLWQRDPGPDFEPCGSSLELHDAVDFLFAAKVAYP